jgi:hypothetical protein
LNIWLHYQQLCIDAEGEVHKKAVAEEGDLPQNFYLNLSPEGQFAWIFHSHISSVLTLSKSSFSQNKNILVLLLLAHKRDIIAVFGGHKTPFVTRPLQGVSRTSRNCCVLPHAREEETVPCFVLLVPCYLHGIMHGKIYSDRYADMFDWAVGPASSSDRIPAQVIHLQ